MSCINIRLGVMTEKMNINVFIPKNNSFFVAIVAVLLLFSVVLYAFPAAFVFLFNDILGNLLLLLGVIGVGYFDFRWGVGLAAIFVILYQAFSLSKTEGRVSKTEGRLSKTGIREGFTQWSSKVKTDFANFQNTHNPNFQFDMNIIQKQASPEEVEYLIKNNKWPWSDSVKAMYKDAVMRNSVISMDPGVAMDVAQTIYNETAVKELLSWNTKEGAFLLTGVTVGHTKGLPDNINNIVRCGTSDSNSNGNSNGGAVMEKITNVGYDGINGSMIKNYAPVPDAEIPKLVPGFKFLKGECNPCVALNDPANYSCPFSLNVGDGGEVSTIWKDLWGLVSGGSSSNNGDGGAVKKEFPLLNELKDELNKASSFLGVAAGAGGKPVVYEDAVSTPDALHNNDSTESPFLNSNM